MKKLAAPLQAVVMLLLCAGMGWMVFVLASINPTPPTAMDLQARNTQDLSFANMNSTAMALAKQMLAEVVPSPTGPYLLPLTGRETVTPDLSVVMTLKPVSTSVDFSTPTLYYITLTATREKPNKLPVVGTNTPVPTGTPRPTIVVTRTRPPTRIPSSTAAPPTAEPATPVPQPTDTQGPIYP